jgi:hypothetical protein
LQGKRGSWLRLARTGNDISGLIFDGHEFFAIAPGRTLKSSLQIMPPGGTDSNLVYRASDMEVDLGENFCSVLSKTGGPARSSGTEFFKAVLGEIASAVTIDGLPTREVEVGLMGDLQFYQRNGADTEQALVSRFNIVDGIFSDQAGLRITVGSLRIFTSTSNPFTTNVPEGLLKQLSKQRQSDSALQAFGLTHLVTGRTLNGDTVGIAFLSGVCDAYFGTSLSEDMGFDVTLSALIAAHELGHNFGAPHDTEAGSACQSTPNGYLMAPAINYSGHFSDCSLGQMQPLIDSAPCIFAARLRDAEVRPIQVPATTSMRTPAQLRIPIRSNGNVAVNGILIVQFNYFYKLRILSAAAGGTPCSISKAKVVCRLGAIPAGETRQVSIVVQSDAVSQGWIRAELSSSNDMVPNNNTAYKEVVFQPRVDVSITADNAWSEGLVGATLTSKFTVSATGLDPGEQVVVRGGFQYSVIKSVTADAGSCAITNGVPICNLGTVPVGQPRHITIKHSPTSAGDLQHQVWIRTLYDDQRGDERVYLYSNVHPRHAPRVYWDEYDRQVTIDEPVTLTANVSNTGSEPLEDTTIRLDFDPALVQVTSVTTPVGQCAPGPASDSWSCHVPLLGGEATAPIVVVAQGSALGSQQLVLQASSPNNDYPADSTASRIVDVLNPHDMYIAETHVEAYDHRDSIIYVTARSAALNDETNVGVTVRIPAGITVVAATPTVGAGSCTIDAGTVTCTFSTIHGPTGQAEVLIDMRSDVVGDFTATATVASTNDAVAANNKVTFPIRVRANIDASISAPASRVMVKDRPYTVKMQLRSASQPIPKSLLWVSRNSNRFAIEAVETEQGSCEGSADRFYCNLRGLPASSSAAVTVRLRTLTTGEDALRFRLWLTGDIDSQNDYVDTLLTIQPAP